jgi:PqqD family protein of HPr-rel-A system
MDSNWALRLRHSLMHRTWGDETVVYEPLSGNTHLLDPVAAAVLDHLGASDATATAIAESLLAEFGAESGDDVLAAVRAALARLRDIGLVRSTDE